MSSDSRSRCLREGERLIQQGKTSLAITEFLKIVKDDPEDVLTLNIIGDLYLRESRTAEANDLFLRVADCYTRTNFLQKAIAVYRKVLNSDPHNLQVNMSLASLYLRQGMNVDARNQYLFVADLCAKEGNTQQAQDAYEKVAEIDPMNSPVQIKLAESYLGQDLQDKAYLSFATAARSQIKKGDIPGAMTSFRRALALKLSSSEALKGFLESALQAGDLRDALNQVKESIDSAEPDPALIEVLGRAYQAAGDLDRAEKYYQMLLQTEDAKFDCFFSLSNGFLDASDPDRALSCLEPAISTIISHRETAKLADAYRRILEVHPHHLPTMKSLADILAAANDEKNYISILERIADYHLEAGNPSEALDPLSRIIQTTPNNEQYLSRHRQVFEKAFPGSPYRQPRGVTEGDATHEIEFASVPPADSEAASTDSTLVEIDLLLNYGMREKALDLLRGLEVRKPKDRDVRTRLASLLREMGQKRLSAEQYVIISALWREAGDEAAAKTVLQDAIDLAPDVADPDMDVLAFAQERGLNIECADTRPQSRAPMGSLEVDLSGDLSEIFFKAGKEVAEEPESAQGVESSAIVDEFTPQAGQDTRAETVEDQLQEVDFYIRLGFQDEARAKLTDIAAICPDNPDLAARCAELGIDLQTIVPEAKPAHPESSPAGSAAEASAGQPAVSEDSSAADVLDGLFSAPAHEQKAVGLEADGPKSGDQKSDGTPQDRAETSSFSAMPSGQFDMPQQAPESVSTSGGAAEFISSPNPMFGDLFEEVNALTSQEIKREDYETHFNLGIAFREMGLTEDAIKEFQIAVKGIDADRSPREMIQCCGMLSTCFLERGMPRSAIRWCRTGLDVREISSHETLALQYDMAVAHASAGDFDQALACFGDIFSIDPGYRDVAQRIDNLKSGAERHAI